MSLSKECAAALLSFRYASTTVTRYLLTFLFGEKFSKDFFNFDIFSLARLMIDLVLYNSGSILYLIKYMFVFVLIWSSNFYGFKL